MIVDYPPPVALPGPTEGAGGLKEELANRTFFARVVL